MTKTEAIELLGGPNKLQRVVAEAVGVSESAISLWPEVLSERIEDRVVAAAARQGLPIPIRHKAAA